LKVFNKLSPELRRNLLVLFTVGLLFWCSLASLLPTLPLYIKSVGATDSQLGWVMGAFAIGLLLFRPALGKLADQRGRKIVILIGLVVAAIAPLGYLFTQSVMLLFAIRVFHDINQSDRDGTGSGNRRFASRMGR
jgi:MFS family permease